MRPIIADGVLDQAARNTSTSNCALIQFLGLVDGYEQVMGCNG
jgi:hypothetical protein